MRSLRIGFPLMTLLRSCAAFVLAGGAAAVAHSASTEWWVLAAQLESDSRASGGRDASRLQALATTLRGRAQRLR